MALAETAQVETAEEGQVTEGFLLHVVKYVKGFEDTDNISIAKPLLSSLK